MKPGGGDGFFRPKPNPDAKPAPTSDGDDESIAGGARRAAGTGDENRCQAQADAVRLLHDAPRRRSSDVGCGNRRDRARGSRPPGHRASGGAAQGCREPGRQRRAADKSPAVPAAATPATDAPADAPYLLQAGAFGASGDAEATKAKVALLGLSARVESAQLNGKTVYRVRMGPYSTASELAEAKRKLASGGLPAMAIKVK